MLSFFQEAEKQELDRFMTAMNTCKWLIWSSTCEVPPPDPLIFLKHMNPLKIGVRMFSVVLSEPMITISETVKTISHGITGKIDKNIKVQLAPHKYAQPMQHVEICLSTFQLSFLCLSI